MLDGIVGEGLVAADIERAEKHRETFHAVKNALIALILFLFGRERAAHNEGEFGAVQPDALGLDPKGDIKFADEIEVGQKLNGGSVAGERFVARLGGESF